jgi:DNA-binding GntR family transcriptional regulator
MAKEKNHENASQTTVDIIVGTLRERIVSGELAGGTALRQDHVAQEFGASHVPAREAFQRLEALGLVVSQPRRGVRVTALNHATIKETTEMRAVLEVLALKHSAPRLTDSDLAIIEAAQARCESAESLAAWDAANREFHAAIIGQCGMPRLLATLKQLELSNSRFVFALGKVRGWQQRSNQDHRLIVDALKAKDVERALLLLTRHIGTMERIGFPAAIES